MFENRITHNNNKIKVMNKICPNCQKIFDDSHSFCSYCGARLIDKVNKKICPNCLEIFENSHSFCSYCGSHLIDNADVSPNKPLTMEEVSKLYDTIVTTSDPSVLTQLQEAADSANMYAMNYIGVCYENGYGVKKKIKEAVKWYQKAAEAGSTTGMCNLGNCYYNGNGVKKNFKEAVKWYQKAIEGGDAYGMSGLGFCYETGNGVKKSLSEALNWYEKSLENGREKDEWIIGRMKACDPNRLEISIYDTMVPFDPPEFHSVEINIDSYHSLGEVIIGYTMMVRNTENRFIKLYCNLSPQNISYPSLSNEYYLIFNEDGTRYVCKSLFDETINISFNPEDSNNFDGETITMVAFSHYIQEFEINKSGTYWYDGNISAYDEDNNLISSYDFFLSITYKHKMFGTDEYLYETL